MDFFPGAMSLSKRVIQKKVWNYAIWWSGICFFKELWLLFYPNVPGATFIQGAMLIQESRVGRIQGYYKKGWNQNLFDPAFYIISNTYVLATYLATAMCHGS